MLAFRSFCLEGDMIFGQYPFKKRGMEMTVREALGAALWSHYKVIYSRYPGGQAEFLHEMFGFPFERGSNYLEFNMFLEKLSNYGDIAFNNFAITNYFDGLMISLNAERGQTLLIEWVRWKGPLYAVWE